MVKNLKIRRKMMEVDMSQGDLGGLLGMTQQEVSIMLKRELSTKEQADIIKTIEEARNER